MHITGDIDFSTSTWYYSDMKTNPNDPINPSILSVDGVCVQQGGLTKLEHFASLIMQTKLNVASLTSHGSVPEGQLSMIARSSVREAAVLIEALNEHHKRIEDSTKKNNTYKVEFALNEILGINTEGTAAAPSVGFSPDTNSGMTKGASEGENPNPMGEDYEHSPSGDL